MAYNNSKIAFMKKKESNSMFGGVHHNMRNSIKFCGVRNFMVGGQPQYKELH